MSIEENKTIVRRIFEEAVNRGNVAVIDELFAPNFVDHSAWPEQGPGPAGIKQAITDFRSTFPDLHITIEHLIAEGDNVVSREIWRGSHAPTGQQVTGTVIHIFQITGGKVIAEWSEGWGWLKQFE